MNEKERKEIKLLINEGIKIEREDLKYHESIMKKIRRKELNKKLK